MNIGNNILTLRKSKGITQDELADKLNVSRQAVSKWELGASKPDIENIIKLSKLFKITIDEIVNNDVIKTEALSVDINEDDKKVDILIWVRRLMVLLAIFFTLNTIYKCVILFRITSIEKQYKELNNYHYVITTYDGPNIYEEAECWYKDGVSKTISTIYTDKGVEKKITNVDYNNKTVSISNENSNEINNVDFHEYSLKHSDYSNGGQLYSTFPNEIQKKNLLKTIWGCFRNFKINIKEYENNIVLDINNMYINLEKKTLLPLLVHYEGETTDSLITQQYLIELNSVKSINI